MEPKDWIPLAGFIMLGLERLVDKIQSGARHEKVETVLGDIKDNGKKVIEQTNGNTDKILQQFIDSQKLATDTLIANAKLEGIVIGQQAQIMQLQTQRSGVGRKDDAAVTKKE